MPVLDRAGRWLIIGGGGVFGIHLARHLLARGASRVVSVGRSPWPQREFSLLVGEHDPRFAYRQIHMVFEPERLQRLIEAEQPDVIVNFAALAYATSWTDAADYYETNVVALARLAEYLTGKPFLKRFVQIGTSELYGSVDGPVDEAAPLRPSSPYAVSKMAGDLHLLTLADRGFPVTIMRPSNCYGEGQLLYRVIPRAAWCARAGARLPLEGGGHVRKSFMHALDLATAIITAATKGEPGRVYNAGPDSPETIRAIVDRVAGAVGLRLDQLIEEAPARASEDACYWLDSSQLRRLGWEPTIHLDDGIRRVVAWVTACFDSLPAPQPFVLRR